MVMEPQAGGGMPLAMRARRLWPDRNPLRRAADRVEFAIAALLLVALLVGVPLTALTAARWAAASGLRAERAQAGWHQVPAVLLHDAPTPPGGLSFPVPWPQVLARWASPAGPRTGKIDAPPGAKAGSTVMVWIDRPGRLTGAPVAAATWPAGCCWPPWRHLSRYRSCCWSSGPTPASSWTGAGWLPGTPTGR